MIAYVHIGTPKTGTTTIQKFLELNYHKLLNNNYLFPLKIRNYGHHFPLLRVCFNNKKEFCMNSSLERTLETSMEYKQSVIDSCEEEIQRSGVVNVIFSSERFVSDIECCEELDTLKEILRCLGASKIKIIIYLREQVNFISSWYSQDIKQGGYRNDYIKNLTSWAFLEKQCDYQSVIERFLKVFGKENLIVRLFDKNEFKDGDLLKDFVEAVGLEWNDEFIIPETQNESLDLIGMELLRGLNRVVPRFLSNYTLEPNRVEIQTAIQRAFVDTKDKETTFKMPLFAVKFLVDYFEESNEWVRKEFFPHKERLFPKKDLTNYKENYEIQEMKQEYWDRIAEFIVDIVKTKNQNIADKTKIIQNKDKVIIEQTTQIKSLQTTIKEKDQIINSNINQINQLQNDIQEKSIQLNQIQSLNKTLSFQTKYGTAKERIKNQLSYKLGQAMINNSKSLLGYIRMPYVLSYIKETHQREQETYQQSIKQNPNLKLPPLESYADYQEALKIKNHLTYKLGAALIKANNVRGGGANICIYWLPKRSA